MTKKKNEKVFDTPQEEIQFLKKQNAGQKGCIAVLQKEVAKLNTSIESRDEIIRKLQSNLNLCYDANKNMKEILKRYQERQSYHRSLPWWKRILCR